jgi:hypothetical protein
MMHVACILHIKAKQQTEKDKNTIIQSQIEITEDKWLEMSEDDFLKCIENKSLNVTPESTGWSRNTQVKATSFVIDEGIKKRLSTSIICKLFGANISISCKGFSSTICSRFEM